jgi:acyl-CoA synthetase (AMP-forming)/AMP-acid ligase II
MNLTMLLDMAADGFGDRVIAGTRASGLTAVALRDAAQRGARLVADRGADAIVYTDVNGLGFPVAMFAAAYAGVPLVPLNYRLGAEQLDALRARHPGAFVVGPGAGALPAQDWLDVTTSTDPFDAVEPGYEDIPAVVIYTSGTTSEPKGVLLRHSNLVSYVFGSVEFASAGDDEAALMSVPPYHIAAVANVITSLYAGRRLITLERFDPQEWLALVRSEGVTNALVVPTMLARLLDVRGDRSLGRLRTLAYGGAPAPSSVVRKALETWPDLDFVNAYGLTETSSTIAVLTPQDHRDVLASQDPFVRARLGSVGRPLPGVQLEIRGSDGVPLGSGVPGRIWVAGDQVSAEYAGKGRQVDERGFFDTRDEGFLDEDGYLFIGGRTDDTIIRGAENVAPAEIEDVLMRHPAIADVAVVGLPDEQWGQRIVAAVVLREGQEVDLEQLREFARSTLRGSKTPEEIVIWSDLPRTETGKLVRRHVVQRFDATV